MTNQIKTIGVIGSGQMGSGIAQVCAAAGFKVWLYDIAHEQLQKAHKNIERSLEKLAEKKKITTEQLHQTVLRLNITSEIKDLKEFDFCIEAVTENAGLKAKIFKQLDETTPPETILASNTSSIPILEIAQVTKRPDKVIGMHFMNPVPLMECIEVICGETTSAETLATTLDLAKKMGKTPVTVKDSPGFVVNRILAPMLNEAVWCLEKGLSSKEDIDLAMKLSCNFPMGPLTLADFIGLDTCLFILEVMHRDLKDDKFKPCPLLKKYVEEGKLGRKTGEGFFKYLVR
ncbi:MAG: 3-hydroxyacyl-CoA dehydrogenase NAD-binding domain-containing protein [Deltaproteobacteria bacterium]|nr:3-hydroxyacyl-CoA dehydrogenase NAD-binding domain-containing protein [Deltaproteobacteria bacterium]